MLAIEIKEARRESLVSGLQAFFLETFEEDLTVFRAEQLLGFFSQRWVRRFIIRRSKMLGFSCKRSWMIWMRMCMNPMLLFSRPQCT